MTDRELAPRNPWEQFGWLMWAGWMPFLLFPLVAALRADVSVGGRVLGVLLVLGFGSVYALGVVRLTRDQQRGPRAPEPVWVLLVLVALAFATTPLIGVTALSFLPFLQSFAVFSLPRPACWIFAGVLLVSTTLGVLVLLGPAETTFVFIVGGVTAAVVAGRLLADHGEAYESAVRGQDVADERERVARDVHDVLGHSLTVLSIKAELAQRLLEAGDPERARAELDDIARLSREALGEVRATVGGLRAARLEEEIDAARVALTGRGIDVDLPEDALEADPRYRPVMGWVLREAATNVVRHSGARRCAVGLEQRSLVVEDDGDGLRGAPEGNGLRGLRERVEQAGGRFVLEPREGGGTRLGVHW